MSRVSTAIVSILAALFLGAMLVPAAQAAPRVPIPPQPNRDQANIDARIFQVSPGVFAFKSPSGNIFCKFDTTAGSGFLHFGCQAKQSVAPAGGPRCSNQPNNKYLVNFEYGKVVHRCTSQGVFSSCTSP